MSIPNPVVLLDARARYVHPAFQMSRASTKTVFDSSVRLVTVPANALGWDHYPATGQARGYLAEPSATNLLLHSNDLTQGAWVKGNSTITPGAITGPDGNGMAKLAEDTSLSSHSLRQDISISNEAAAFQSIVKEAGRANVQLRIIETGNASNSVNCIFDLTSGTLTNPGSSGSGVSLGAGISYIADGFYRVWVAGSLGSGVSNYRCQAFLYNDGLTYEGDGTSGVYIGNIQAEEGSYPTSYIETGGATATRSADLLLVTNLQEHPWWLSTRGTLVLDVDVRSNNFDYNATLMSFSNELRFSSGPEKQVVLSGTLMSSNIDMTGNAPQGRYCMAAAWDDEEVAGAQGGALMGQTSLAAPLRADPALSFGTNPASTLPSNSIIHRAVYYPARISNADLQSLTAIQE